MIVLAIIATLAAIAVPNYQAFVDKSRVSRAIASRLPGIGFHSSGRLIYDALS